MCVYFQRERINLQSRKSLDYHLIIAIAQWYLYVRKATLYRLPRVDIRFPR